MIKKCQIRRSASPYRSINTYDVSEFRDEKWATVIEKHGKRPYLHVCSRFITMGAMGKKHGIVVNSEQLCIVWLNEKFSKFSVNRKLY